MATLDQVLYAFRTAAAAVGVPVDQLPRRKFTKVKHLHGVSERQVKRYGSYTEVRGMAAGLNVAAPESPSGAVSLADLPQDTWKAADALHAQLSGSEAVTEIDVKQPTEEGSDCLIVTWAQNATPVHDEFWASLLQFAEINNARIVVIAGRYRNPTSPWESVRGKVTDWWDVRLEPYITHSTVRVCEGFRIAGDVPIQPTASTPLTGFEGHAGSLGGIYGHPKQQRRPVASFNGSPKHLFSTGAVTVENYSLSRAGKKGHRHHIFGALVVQRTGDVVRCRHISAGHEGEFVDLGYLYTPYGREEAPQAEALVLGDVHVANTEPNVLAGTLGASEFLAELGATYTGPAMVHHLRPKYVVLHDLLDFRSQNHHERGHPKSEWYRSQGVINPSVADELNLTCRFIDEAVPADVIPVIVRSNHDDALDRWLNDPKAAHDAPNSKTWHALNASLREHSPTAWDDAFRHWYERFYANSGREVVWLTDDCSFKLRGVELAAHGHLGPNGARGSLRSFARLGIVAIIAHSHSPGMLDGVTQVGVSAKKQQGYNKGPSSWDHTHAVLYSTGKRALLDLGSDGTWT